MSEGISALEAFVETIDARALEGVAFDETIRPDTRDRRESRRPLPFTEATLELGEVIGEGGMGIVRLAIDGGLEREVAVKTVRDELREDARAVERLIREARVTGLVEHPNVVPLHALVRGPDGDLQMVMKRIEGVPWRTLIHDPSHPEMPRDAGDPLVWHIEVLMRVCDAVHYAHSKGILHLDIKPDNVMIGRFREVYLADWGIAASTRESHRGKVPLASDLRDLIGTPAYIAPELVRPAERAPDERTDVYLLAAALHEVVAGQPPHAGTSIVEVLFSALADEERALPDHVPAELAAIVRRGLSRDPEARFESAEALRTALAAFLAHRSSARLAERAAADLEALERDLASGSTTPPAQRLGECLFGFRAALHEWPENEAARRGLGEAQLRMAAHYLASGETSAAQALLDEASDLSEDQTTRHSELAARAAEQAKRERELTDLGREQDLSPGIKRRALGVASFGTLLNASAIYVWYQIPTEQQWSFLLAASVLLLATVFGLVWYWRRHDTTRGTRRLSLSLFVLFALLLVGRLGMWSRGLSVEQAAMNDVFLLCGCGAITGVLFDRRVWAFAVFMLVAWVLMIVLPPFFPVWIVLGSTLGVAAMTFLWFRGVPP